MKPKEIEVRPRGRVAANALNGFEVSAPDGAASAADSSFGRPAITEGGILS